MWWVSRRCRRRWRVCQRSMRSSVVLPWIFAALRDRSVERAQVSERPGTALPPAPGAHASGALSWRKSAPPESVGRRAMRPGRSEGNVVVELLGRDHFLPELCEPLAGPVELVLEQPRVIEFMPRCSICVAHAVPSILSSASEARELSKYQCFTRVALISSDWISGMTAFRLAVTYRHPRGSGNLLPEPITDADSCPCCP